MIGNGDFDAWHAGHVARWHSGPWCAVMARVGDTNAAHSGRMAALALTMWPDASRNLLAAIVAHDLGEYAVADVPLDAISDPTLRSALDRLEAAALERMGLVFGLSLEDHRRLKFLDRLDAYLMVQTHAPHFLEHEDWQAARRWLWAEADQIGGRMPETKAKGKAA